jgi:hypothetical protein
MRKRPLSKDPGGQSQLHENRDSSDRGQYRCYSSVAIGSRSLENVAVWVNEAGARGGIR